MYSVPRTVLSFPRSESFKTATDGIRGAVLTCVFTGVTGGVEREGHIQDPGPAGDRAPPDHHRETSMGSPLGAAEDEAWPGRRGATGAPTPSHVQ